MKNPIEHGEISQEYINSRLSKIDTSVGVYTGIVVALSMDFGFKQFCVMFASFALVFYLSHMAFELWVLRKYYRFALSVGTWVWFYYWGFIKQDLVIGVVMLCFIFIASLVARLAIRVLKRA